MKKEKRDITIKFIMKKTLCPNGVEYKNLGSIVNILDNFRRPVSKEKREKGIFPYYGANGIQDYVKDFIFDGTFLLIGEDGSVINKDNSPVLNWATGKIWVNNHAHILSEKEGHAKLRYVYFYLSTINVKGIVHGTPPKLNQTDLKNIPIPLPPLEVQEEIVRILDTFTGLIDNLNEELVLRKKQYEYYRNKLLTPIEKDGKHYLNGKEVEWKTLGEVLEYEQPTKYIVNSTNYNDDYKTPVLTAGQTFILGHTNEKENIFNADEDNPVIIFDDFTTSFHWVNFNFKVKSSAMKILKIKNNIFNNINFKYCYYAMKCINYIPQEHARQWISKYSTFPIPIPPIEEQERIVKILDKFDALVNDLSEGIPAEIEARTKQYEYYRNKLLRFE